MFSVTSGRSGGVVGDVVMDLAVGLQIPFIKNGCPRSGERIDKLNFLMRVKDNYPGCHMAKIDDIGPLLSGAVPNTREFPAGNCRVI